MFRILNLCNITKYYKRPNFSEPLRRLPSPVEDISILGQASGLTLRLTDLDACGLKKIAGLSITFSRSQRQNNIPYLKIEGLENSPVYRSSPTYDEQQQIKTGQLSDSLLNHGLYELVSSYSIESLKTNTQNASISNIEAVNLTQNTNITTAQSKADAAFHQANGAYTQANTNATNITVIQGVNLTQNTNITTAQDTATAAFIAANNATDTYVRNHANSAFHQANAAYAQANTNATNITVIQGVNTTQNTNITAAQAKADASFHQANGAFAQANTNATNITVIQGVNTTQNTNISNIQGVDLTQNTNITAAQAKADASFHQANGAYTQANTNATNITVIQGVNLTQNASISNIEAVNLTQNTNITTAQSKADAAFHQANGAFVQANTNATNITVIQGVDVRQNNRITYAENHANAAFAKANTGASTSNVTITTFATTANGAQTTFNLGWNPVSAETVIATIDGVIQPDSSYNVSNTANTITFTTAPASGEAVRVISLYSSACTNLYIIADGSVTTPKIADDAVTVSKLSQSTEDYILEKSIAMSIALG